MPHINDARAELLNLRIDRRHYTNPAGAIPAEINCALCACAGVVTHGSGNFTTSGDVARSIPYTGALAGVFNGTNPVYQHSQSFSGKTYTAPSVSKIGAVNDQQVRGILGYCRANIPDLVIAFEYDAQPLDGAIGEMRSLGRDFIFAVLVSRHGHWNFAHNKREGVEFVDYQSDHAAYEGTARGKLPQLGIRPGTEFHDGNTRVLAFHVPGYVPHDIN